MSIFKGCCTALVTPFKDGKVDYGAFGSLIEKQIESGVDALLVCGSTGEPATMTLDERLSAIDFVIKRTAGRVPVVAGSGANSTHEAIEMSKKAEALGADALLVVTPYYNKTSQKGLYLHYKAVCDAVSKPVILYNVPARTGLNVKPPTLEKISYIDNLVAIKEASGDIQQEVEMCRLVLDRMDVYSGNDYMVVPLMSVGAIGCISVVSNIAPVEMTEMTHAFLNGDIRRAMELQLRMKPLNDICFLETNPIPVKTAMNLMGMNMGELRLPLCEMEESNLQKLKAVLAEYKMI